MAKYSQYGWIFLVMNMCFWMGLDSAAITPEGFFALPVMLSWLPCAFWVVKDLKSKVRPRQSPYHLMTWSYICVWVGLSFGSMANNLTRQVEGPELAMSLTLAIQFVAVISLVMGEATARLATDNVKWGVLVFPIYIQVDLFQVAAFRTVSITDNFKAFMGIVFIQELSGLYKNCGLFAFFSYLIKRYIICNKEAINPYRNGALIERLLTKGAIDSVTEILACFLVPVLLVSEVVMIRALGKEGESSGESTGRPSCSFTCNMTEIIRHVKNDSFVDLDDVHPVDYDNNLQIGSIIASYFALLCFRIFFLFLERTALTFVHRRSISKVVPNDDLQNRDVDKFGSLGFVETIGRFFVHEADLYFYVWTAFSVFGLAMSQIKLVSIIRKTRIMTFVIWKISWKRGTIIKFLKSGLFYTSMGPRHAPLPSSSLAFSCHSHPNQRPPC